VGRPKLIICHPKLIYYQKTLYKYNMSQISKSTQSSESDTDFIQEITINSVYGDSIGSENDTPAKAKRGLNKIYTKYKEYDTYKEAIEDI
jgi:hypothetical protein